MVLHFLTISVARRWRGGVPCLTMSFSTYNCQSLLDPLQTLYVGVGFHRARWCVFAIMFWTPFSYLNNEDHECSIWLYCVGRFTPTVCIQDSVEEFGPGLPTLKRMHNCVQCLAVACTSDATRRLSNLAKRGQHLTLWTLLDILVCEGLTSTRGFTASPPMCCSLLVFPCCCCCKLIQFCEASKLPWASPSALS